jgi:hypothetical protein
MRKSLISIFVFAVSLIAEFPAQAVGQAAPEVQPEPPAIKAVLELFTSQGCSSCPAADALFKSYAERKDVIALSLPVDYWDYLGWKDTLGSPRNSERQRAYAKTRGDGAIYTPQMVVNGVTHVNGANSHDIDAAIARMEEKFSTSRIPIRFWNQSNKLMIETGTAPENLHVREGQIWLAIVQKYAQVAVRGGENEGKKLSYYNVVRELTPVAMWTGKPMTIQLARTAVMRPDSEAAVILIQAGHGGPIIGAAWSGLW